MHSPYNHYPTMGRQNYMPGTLLRLYIPPGACINLLNMLEVASPKGIDLIVRVPFLANSPVLGAFLAPLLQAGGRAMQLPAMGGYPEYYKPYYC